MEKKWISLLFWVVLCLCVGFLGSLFEPGEWYQSIKKSSLTPPNIVFPIVWNILFVLMGIAAWRAWRRSSTDKVFFVLLIFFLQLGFNVIWSYLFFGLERPDLALIEIFILWALILVTLITFYKIDSVAGLLIVPYLIWVSFAIYLNYSVYHLNNF